MLAREKQCSFHPYKGYDIHVLKCLFRNVWPLSLSLSEELSSDESFVFRQQQEKCVIMSSWFVSSVFAVECRNICVWGEHQICWRSTVCLLPVWKRGKQLPVVFYFSPCLSLFEADWFKASYGRHEEKWKWSKCFSWIYWCTIWLLFGKARFCFETNVSILLSLLFIHYALIGRYFRASQRKRKLMKTYFVHFSILSLVNQMWTPFWSWTQLFHF